MNTHYSRIWEIYFDIPSDLVMFDEPRHCWGLNNTKNIFKACVFSSVEIPTESYCNWSILHRQSTKNPTEEELTAFLYQFLGGYIKASIYLKKVNSFLKEHNYLWSLFILKKYTAGHSRSNSVCPNTLPLNSAGSCGFTFYLLSY